MASEVTYEIAVTIDVLTTPDPANATQTIIDALGALPGVTNVSASIIQTVEDPSGLDGNIRPE
jgi:hypothetical protein